MMHRNCGTKDDPIQVKRNILQNYRDNRVTDNGQTIYIGIVFHICFKNYNIADVELDIQHTIQMLNRDFNKNATNFNNGKTVYTDSSLKQTYDSYVARADSCKMFFYKVETKYVPLNSFNSSDIDTLDNSIKGASPALNPSKYLNFWVADFQNGLLGYAQFPWSLKSNPNTDGIVIAKGTFGRNPTFSNFDLNKTATHEIGHWLGLYHTFQDTFNYQGGNIDYQDGTLEEEIQEMKGDCVADTPPQLTPTYGNPYLNSSTWPTSKPTDETKAYRHIFMDFMDYSDDIAMFMFTNDQAIKARQMVYIYRPNMLSNNPNTTTTTTTTTTIPPTTTTTTTTTIPPTTTTTTTTTAPPGSGFSQLYHGFEDGDGKGWTSTTTINNNNNGTDVEITQTYPHTGKKSLRTRRYGRFQLTADLVNSTSATISLWVKAINSNTYIWVQPPNSTLWYYARFPTSNTYKQYSFLLPGPLSNNNKNTYKFRLGTDGFSQTYSYFDDVKIVNNRTAKVESEGSLKKLTKTTTEDNMSKNDKTRGIQNKISELKKFLKKSVNK